MTSSLSRKVVIGTMIAFVLALLGIMGRIAPYLDLDPTRLQAGEVWRLVSYPLAIGFFDLVSAAVAFSAPGEEVESMLGSRQLMVLLLIVITGGGLLHTLLYFDEQVSMSGTLNVALFVITGYVYLFPHSSVRVLFFSMRSWIVLTGVVGVCAVQSYVDLSYGLGPAIIFSHGLFGLLFGSLYFHLRYQKYHVMLGPIRQAERLYARLRISSGLTVGAATRRKPPAVVRKGVRSGERSVGSEQEGNEDRLNGILDRINAHGYESLSHADRAFLERYSRGIS